MDRSCSFGGNGGPIFQEIRHAIYDLPDRPQLINYIYGLGGRDTPPFMIASIFNELVRIVETGKIQNLVQ